VAGHVESVYRRSAALPIVLLGAAGLAGFILLVPGVVLIGLLVAIALVIWLICRPRQGYYLALLLLPLSPLLALLPVGLEQVIGHAFYFFLVVGLCLVGAMIGPRRVQVADPLLKPLMIFSALVLLSATVNVWRFIGSDHLDLLSSGLKGVLANFLAYLLTIRVIQDLRDVRRITLFMLAVSVVVSLLGIAQIMSFFLGFNWGTLSTFLATKVSDGFRMNASFDDAAALAFYYLIILPLGLSLSIGLTGLGRATRYGIFAAMLLAFPPFVLALNKSSYLALIPAVLALTLLKRSVTLLALQVFGGLGFLAITFPIGILGRLLNYLSNLGEADDVAGRWEIWKAMLASFVAEPHIPLIGAGPYGNRIVSQPLLAAVGLGLSHSHNEVLELLTNYGLLGAATFLFMLYRIACIAWGITSRDPFIVALRYAFLSSLIALVLQSLVFNVFIDSPLFWIMAGLMVRTDALLRPADSAGSRS